MLLDIGLGLLAAMFASELGAIPLTHSLALWGVAYALLPDLDAVWYMLQKRHLKKGSYEHRDALHFPLPYLAAGSIVLALLRPEHLPLFLLGGLFHFVHDSIGIGWGVEWLYPFSRKHFSFLYIYRPPRPPRLPKQLLYAWEHRDLAALDDTYGDPDWVKNIYLKAHPYAIAELLLFLLALTAYFLVQRMGLL